MISLKVVNFQIKKCEIFGQKFKHLTAADLQLHPADCPPGWNKISQRCRLGLFWDFAFSEMRIDDVYDSSKLNISWYHIINYFVEVKTLVDYSDLDIDIFIQTWVNHMTYNALYTIKLWMYTCIQCISMYNMYTMHCISWPTNQSILLRGLFLGCGSKW